MKPSSTLLAFIILIYIYLVYNYVSNLKSCSCVEGKSADKVKTAEGFMMSVILLWIFVKLIGHRNPIFSHCLSIILFLTYIYFCYHVYQMNKTITVDCLCAMKWQKWLLDIQYGALLIEIVLVFSTMLF